MCVISGGNPHLWHVTQDTRHLINDTSHVTLFSSSSFCMFNLILYLIAFVLLSADVERFSVSRMRDLVQQLNYNICLPLKFTTSNISCFTEKGFYINCLIWPESNVNCKSKIFRNLYLLQFY